MARTLQIRDVPEDLHQALRERAARAGLSLSDYLRAELTRVAERPPVADVLARAASRHETIGRAEIVEAVRQSRSR